MRSCVCHFFECKITHFLSPSDTFCLSYVVILRQISKTKGQNYDYRQRFTFSFLLRK